MTKFVIIRSVGFYVCDSMKFSTICECDRMKCLTIRSVGFYVFDMMMFVVIRLVGFFVGDLMKLLPSLPSSLKFRSKTRYSPQQLLQRIVSMSPKFTLTICSALVLVINSMFFQNFYSCF